MYGCLHKQYTATIIVVVHTRCLFTFGAVLWSGNNCNISSLWHFWRCCCLIYLWSYCIRWRSWCRHSAVLFVMAKSAQSELLHCRCTLMNLSSKHFRQQFAFAGIVIQLNCRQAVEEVIGVVWAASLLHALGVHCHSCAHSNWVRMLLDFCSSRLSLGQLVRVPKWLGHLWHAPLYPLKNRCSALKSEVVVFAPLVKIWNAGDRVSNFASM